MFAVAAMLLTTSCSNDETNELISGEPVTTSFKVQLPNSIGTRPNKGAKKAFADGMTATVLKYMVFDENNNLVIPAAEKAINRSTDVQLTLITGKKDLGAIAMTYGNVYVAQVAMGANEQHLITALKEALFA